MKLIEQNKKKKNIMQGCIYYKYYLKIKLIDIKHKKIYRYILQHKTFIRLCLLYLFIKISFVFNQIITEIYTHT